MLELILLLWKELISGFQASQSLTWVEKVRTSLDSQTWTTFSQLGLILFGFSLMFGGSYLMYSELFPHYVYHQLLIFELNQETLDVTQFTTTSYQLLNEWDELFQLTIIVSWRYPLMGVMLSLLLTIGWSSAETTTLELAHQLVNLTHELHQLCLLEENQFYLSCSELNLSPSAEETIKKALKGRTQLAELNYHCACREYNYLLSSQAKIDLLLTFKK